MIEYERKHKLHILFPEKYPFIEWNTCYNILGNLCECKIHSGRDYYKNDIYLFEVGNIFIVINYGNVWSKFEKELKLEPSHGYEYHRFMEMVKYYICANCKIDKKLKITVV